MWIVLYVNGGRIGSVPLAQRETLAKAVYWQRIQTDANGTEHWHIFGVKKAKTPTKHGELPV